MSSSPGHLLQPGGLEAGPSGGKWLGFLEPSQHCFRHDHYWPTFLETLIPGISDQYWLTLLESLIPGISVQRPWTQCLPTESRSHEHWIMSPGTLIPGISVQQYWVWVRWPRSQALSSQTAGFVSSQMAQILIPGVTPYWFTFPETLIPGISVQQSWAPSRARWLRSRVFLQPNG